MHTVALFGTSLLIFLRILGLIISVEFKLELKEYKFNILVIGWIVWIIGGFSSYFIGIFDNQLLNDFFQLINGTATSIAILFVMTGLFSYFQIITKKILLGLSLIFIFLPLVTFLLGFSSIAYKISSGFLFVSAILFSILPLRKLNVFKNKLSIKSFYWYLALSINIYFFLVFFMILLLQGYSFGFYSNEFSLPMFFNYFITCISSIIIIIYTIHLEYDISQNKKLKLTDKYSHDLGNLIQVIYSATDLTNIKDDLSKEKAKNLELIQEKCEEAANLLKEIKKID